MTCIAAWIEGNQVWMGADSAGVGGLSMSVRADQKIFRNGPYLIGFTSSFRMGQILRYAFTPPAPPGNRTMSRFMVTTFVDAVRAVLKQGGFASKKEEVEQGGCFIVGCNGRIFTIESDYQVAEQRDGFAATGCGIDIALGAFHSTKTFDMKPRERVRAALMAAERFSAGVRRPFVIKHI